MSKERNRKNWLSSYLDYTKAQESPQIYHLWSGISVIAGLLSRECFIDQGYFKIYPNHYIVIVGNSGKFKKSTAVNLALGFHNEVEHKNPVRSRKITAEKFLQNLDRRNKDTGVAYAYVFNSELSVFVGRNTDKHGIIDIMTEAYDCTDIINETKGAGTDRIENTFINWIACTTPQDLNRMSGVMVDGGLAGRIVFIASDEQGAPVNNALKAMNQLEGITELKESLLSDLLKIKKIKGEFTLSDEADAIHKEIYDSNFYREDFPPKLAPYQQRKGIHLLKLAMICSASVKDERVITAEDMTMAIELLEQAERCMPLALSGMPLLEIGQQLDVILQQIVDNRGSIGHSELLRRNQRHMDGTTIGRILDSLVQSDMIETVFEGKAKIHKLLSYDRRGI